MAQELDLQVGDVVEVINRGLFTSAVQINHCATVCRVERFPRGYVTYHLRFDSGLEQVCPAPAAPRCIRKVPTQDTPRIKEVPHDTTTPLKVGDYVEVLYDRRRDGKNLGLVGRVRLLHGQGCTVTLPCGDFFYKSRTSLSLIKQ